MRSIFQCNDEQIHSHTRKQKPSVLSFIPSQPMAMNSSDFSVIGGLAIISFNLRPLFISNTEWLERLTGQRYFYVKFLFEFFFLFFLALFSKKNVHFSHLVQSAIMCIQKELIRNKLFAMHFITIKRFGMQVLYAHFTAAVFQFFTFIFMCTVCPEGNWSGIQTKLQYFDKRAFAGSKCDNIVLFILHQHLFFQCSNRFLLPWAWLQRCTSYTCGKQHHQAPFQSNRKRQVPARNVSDMHIWCSRQKHFLDGPLCICLSFSLCFRIIK